MKLILISFLAFLVISICFPLSKTGNIQKFLTGVKTFGVLYFIFMGTIDVPMYYARWQEDTLSHKNYESIAKGFQESFFCRHVTKADEVWIPEMPWMTGYFTFGVWFAIWLGVNEF